MEAFGATAGMKLPSRIDRGGMTTFPVQPSSCDWSERLDTPDAALFDWENLRHYVTFARTQSLSSAARELGVEHATVARRIAALESSLNLKLVDRRKRNYEMTPFGHRIAEIAGRMQKDAKAIAKMALSVRTEMVADLSVSAPPLLTSEFIAPHLGRLRHEHPSINVSLLMQDDLGGGGNPEPDLMIRLCRPTQMDLVARKFGTVSFGLYGSSQYLAAHTREQYEYILYDESMEHSRQQVWLREIAAERPVVLRARSLEVQASAARAGVGMALLPNFYARKDPTLEKAQLNGSDLMIDIWLVVHEDLRKEAPIRSLMDFLVSCFPSEAFF